MYIKHLLRRTSYSILDLISEDCLNNFNNKFHTYYKKRKLKSEANLYADQSGDNEFNEIKRIMQEIPKGAPNIR